METQEKNTVRIILTLVGSPLKNDDVCAYLDIEAEHCALTTDKCWSLETSGSLILENEWQSLRNVLSQSWDKIPQLLSLGGHIKIQFLSHINDRYPVIIMSPQIIKDMAYLKANVQML